MYQISFLKNKDKITNFYKKRIHLEKEKNQIDHRVGTQKISEKIKIC